MSTILVYFIIYFFYFIYVSHDHDLELVNRGLILENSNEWMLFKMKLSCIIRWTMKILISLDHLLLYFLQIFLNFKSLIYILLWYSVIVI